MNLRAIGCNVESAGVELREKLAFDDAKLRRALAELSARYGVEAVILGTCNRVELYLGRPEVGAPSTRRWWPSSSPKCTGCRRSAFTPICTNMPTPRRSGTCSG